MKQDGSILKMLAVIEATTLIGPAKNLIEFCRRARTLNQSFPHLPAVEASIVTFYRSPHVDSSVTHVSANQGDAHADETVNQFVVAANESGVEVDVIGERRRFDGRVLAEFRKIVERRKPDIIQTHQVKSHFLMKLSGMRRRYPWIAFHHGYTTTDLKMRAYNQLNRWSLPSADRVITVCEAFAQRLTREGVAREKIFVRHNSINTNGEASSEEDTRALKAQLGIKENARIVLAVGRLSREKAHVDLISALGHLRRVNAEIDFKLVIVGEGPERAHVEGEIALNELGARVIFAGQVSNVRPFYSMADVLALPSHSEGSPNVLLEAMAANLPIVATAVGGVPEIVTHDETALLVAPRAREAMAAALARVLTDEPLAHRLASNASALVAARYTPESYARSIVEVYCQLVPGANAASTDNRI